ncbi:MAG TPA: sigma-70 family RNA polymerase sigma factor [Pyrinomonadaceae bacterium]|nr:sigma-70 family RNA polymerase sigma factor [Pyrinomonadaceae bacterium]
MSQARPETDARDRNLLAAVARKDERAFAELYDTYASILFGLLLRILHSRAEAEDVLQELFLQVWQQAPSFDPTRGRPFTWLVTLARSRAIDRLRAVESRKRTAQRSAEDFPAGEPASSKEEAADELALRGERAEVVRGALAELPEEQRSTLLLAYLGGLSQTEIAEQTGQPLGTVKTRTRSGLKKLHELLRNRYGEGVV